ncbi:MAG: hypothetical protein BWY42_01502 [Candidatus Omnitrophica bacterium ADurb.Bin277]|nr:MAG: hypothetical protein BWY42_01502 [Candidatus Omnitrophica bacterium ADurb.Bin277]
MTGLESLHGILNTRRKLSNLSKLFFRRVFAENLAAFRKKGFQHIKSVSIFRNINVRRIVLGRHVAAGQEFRDRQTRLSEPQHKLCRITGFFLRLPEKLKGKPSPLPGFDHIRFMIHAFPQKTARQDFGLTIDVQTIRFFNYLLDRLCLRPHRRVR